ncbi:MAG: DUF4159 domain-containing protein [Gammaproteobacteria bacterium]|nr:DUF4159 domain-containing protein [Gammaproteobacteria bacterium]
MTDGPASRPGRGTRIASLRPRPLRLLALLSAALLLAHLKSASSQSAPAFDAGAARGEFEFARLMYADAGGRRGRGAWLTDYPEAEVHLLQGLERLTRVTLGGEGTFVDLQSDDVMDYPWLYAVEVGRWHLSDAEAARLREYLMRGGFLIVDDFWGSYQWSVFIASMLRVFPDRRIVEIPEDDEVMHVLYDLERDVQIPGIRYIYTGRTSQGDGITPHWRGIYDDEGRLMVAINFNMDLGDAWEHADHPAYPEPMTTLAYRFAVNYVIYSMTH